MGGYSKKIKNANYSGPVILELCYQNEYSKMTLEEFYKKGYELGNKLARIFDEQ